MARRLISLLVLVAALSFVAPSAAIALAPDSFSIEQQYSRTQVTGMAFDGTYLWTSSAYTGFIYKHALDGHLTVLAAYPSPAGKPYGITFDGTNLWSVDWVAKKIYKHNMDAALSVAASFDAHARYHPVGIAFDGQSIWTTDVDLVSSSYAKIRKHNMDATLSVAEEHTGPYDAGFKRYAELRGITWYHGELWATNYLYGFPASLIKFDASFQPERYYLMSQCENTCGTTVGDSGWTGLCWVGTELWVGNYFGPVTLTIPTGATTFPDGGDSGDTGGSDTGDGTTGGDSGGSDEGDDTGDAGGNPGNGEKPFPGNTPPGSDVCVSLERGVTIRFGKVLAGGETTVSFTDAGPYGPPAGFRYRNHYFSIATTATYEGPVSITVDYGDEQVKGSDRSLKLFYRQDDEWVDITTCLDREHALLTGTADTL